MNKNTAIKFSDSIQQLKYVDIETDRIPYAFKIVLGNRTFCFIVKYNEIGKFYTIDLLNAKEELLVCGEIVRYGRPLFNLYIGGDFPSPVIIPLNVSNSNISSVTKENFGREVKLYLFDR